MTRRAFITLLGGAAAAWPLAARAQQSRKVQRIGYLGNSSPTLEPHYVEAFRQKLRDLGHVEGENIAIEYRWAEGSRARCVVAKSRPGGSGRLSSAALSREAAN